MKRDSSQVRFKSKFTEVEADARKAELRIAQLEKMESELMNKLRTTANKHHKVINNLQQVVYT